MVISHNEKDNTYSITEVSPEELLGINQLIESAGLSLKRTFYDVHTAIDEIIKKATQPKKITAHGNN